MDANAAAGGGEEKAVAPRDAAPTSPRAAAEAAVGGDAAGADGVVAANLDRSGGAGEEEEDDDEQQAVERFYALVANVRAMRGMYRTSGDGASADSNAAAGGERKRARRADQPWRPVFRMEDFAEAGAAPAPSTSPTAGDGASRVPPVRQTAGEEGEDDVELRRGRRAAASSSSPPPRRSPPP